MGEDVRGLIFKFTRSSNYTKQKVYIIVNLLSVKDFLTSAAVHHFGKMGNKP